MIIIFAVDRNWAIGLKGDMLTKISKDLKRFKELTSGNIIVMGRKTFESLPNQKPLPNRVNIVITKDKSYKREGITVLNSIEELDSYILEINPNQEKKVFLIGGGNLVSQLMDKVYEAYITKIDKAFSEYDTVIPNLDKLEGWKIVDQTESFLDEATGLNFKHLKYKKY